MSPTKETVVFLAVIFILLALSIGATYYQYMVRQDFTYFQTTDQIPDRFSLSSYSEL